MTLYPSKAAQKAWVKKHLNGGVCPATEGKWRELFISIGYPGFDALPCYDALNWLANSDITTLAEAWERCDEPAWLAWALLRMEPDEEDVAKVSQMYDWLVAAGPVKLRDRAEFDRSWLARTYYTSVENKMSLFCGDLDTYSDDLRKPQRRKIADKMRELWGNPWKVQK